MGPSTSEFLKSAMEIAEITGCSIPEEYLEPLIEDVKEDMRKLREKVREVKLIRDEENRVERDRIENGINFELSVIYDTYPGDNSPKKVDFIPLEGWNNAVTIFMEYRKIGHKLNLYSITLTLDDKKVKRVFFKK